MSTATIQRNQITAYQQPIDHVLAALDTDARRGLSEGEAREVFLEQAEALLEGGSDALLLETFTDLTDLRLAYEAVSALGAPVLAYPWV